MKELQIGHYVTLRGPKAGFQIDSIIREGNRTYVLAWYKAVLYPLPIEWVVDYTTALIEDICAEGK